MKPETINEIRRNLSAIADEHLGQLTLPGGHVIVIGIPPREPGSGYLVAPPRTPHIFLANHVESPNFPEQHDMVMLDAHGYRDENNVWRFGDQQPVIPLVLAFNDFATKHGLPPVQVVLACNRRRGDKELANDTQQLVDAGVTFMLNGIVNVKSTVGRRGSYSFVHSPSAVGFANMPRKRS